MKTCYLKVATLCSVALFLGACSKDNDTQSTQKEIQHPKDPIEQLRTFRKQIAEAKAHPVLRSHETITLTEALWDVENHFNMTYSDPEQYYGRIASHELNFTLPVNETQRVLVHDAINLYNQLIVEARQVLSSEDFENKGLISMHLVEAEELEGELRVKFETKIGERCAYNPPGTVAGGPFGPNDNWMFASPMGKCDDPDIPSGADQQLQEKLFDALIGTFPETSPGQRNIYLDRKCFYFDGHDYDNVFIAYDGDDHCIPYLEMNRYFNGERYIISYTLPKQYHLYNYQPISIMIHTVHDDTDDSYTHFNEIEYGQLYRVNIDEFGEREELL